MVGRKLRSYNDLEQKAFQNLFESIECNEDELFIAIASKMYRHEYCLVGHDLEEKVINWFKNCGLNVKISDKDSIYTEIELI
jgi:hypothetical protein